MIINTISMIFTKSIFYVSNMTDKFESYDYGDQNMNHYGQETPITYDLSKVVVGCEYTPWQIPR